MYNSTENIFLSLDITPHSDLNFFEEKAYHQLDSMMNQQTQTSIPQVKQEVELFDVQAKKQHSVVKSNNKKNAFIKKINSLMNLQTMDTINSQQVVQQNCQNNDRVRDLVLEQGSNKSQDKLQKNRNTARVSRMRKKYYIDLLENKLQQITDEIYYQQQNRNNGHNKLQIQENNQLASVQQNQQDMLNKLQMSLFDNNFTESQVLLVLESYQSKVGPNGFFRKMLIDGLLNQLKNNYLPKGMVNILRNSKSSIFSEFEPELQQISNNYTMLLKQLEQIKNNYLQTNKQIENLVNEATIQQRPSQIADLIVNSNHIDETTQYMNKEWFFNDLLQQSQELQKRITKNNNEFLKNYSQINDCRVKKIKFNQL